MVDLLLLHGAWFGAWSWQPLVEELAARSLTAVAVDLPAADAGAGVEDYVTTALGPLGADDEPLVVGHSLAGILLEPLAARRPVSGLVYLAAFVPQPGVSLREQWRRHGRETFVPGWDRGLRSGPGDVSAWEDGEGAIATLFGRCPRERAEDAVARLRPQAWHLADSVFEGELETPSACIVAADDRLLDPGPLAADAAARLGIEATTIAADHCPMLSAPGELAARLAVLVER